MMDELKEVKRALNPKEVLLVVDAMTGQEAAGTQTTHLSLVKFHKNVAFCIKYYLLTVAYFYHL